MPGDEKAIIIVIVAVFLICTVTFIGFGLFKITQGHWNTKEKLGWSLICFMLCLSTTVLYTGLVKFF